MFYRWRSIWPEGRNSFSATLFWPWWSVILPWGQPLKQFMLHVVNVLDDFVCSTLALTGLDFPQAWRWRSLDAFSILGHPIKSFLVLSAIGSKPDADISIEYKLYWASVERFLGFFTRVEICAKHETILRNMNLQLPIAVHSLRGCHQTSKGGKWLLSFSWGPPPSLWF